MKPGHCEMGAHSSHLMRPELVWKDPVVEALDAESLLRVENAVLREQVKKLTSDLAASRLTRLIPISASS